MPEALASGAAEPPGVAAPPVAAEAEAETEAEYRDPPGSLAARVRDRLPLAIVAVSVLAAVMGWRASLADESASHKDELSRQDLIRQQDSVLQKIQGVAADIKQFGTFEQSSVLAQQLSGEAARAGGAEGQSLTREAQADTELAREIGARMQYDSDYTPTNPTNYHSDQNSGALNQDGTYRPGNPYTVSAAIAAAESGDAELTGLEPDLLRKQARAERQKGVDLVGVAALFIAGLVCFTIAAVSRGRQVVWLAASGVTIAVIAIVLFSIAELT